MDISVIVPTFNRDKLLEQCLVSLFTQDYPLNNYEIIVIDDGSNDETHALLKQLCKMYKNLQVIKKNHLGPATLRNIGIVHARSDLIAFTDDDCIVEKQWVKKCVESHRKHPSVTAIGGLTEIDRSNVRCLVSQELSNGAIQANIDGKDETIFFPTCNLTLKKTAFNGNRFNELFPLPAGEDLEFSWKLFKGGHRLLYERNIKIFHDRKKDLISFLKQAYCYGRGNLLVKHTNNHHPLLKELKTGKISFWLATMLNLLKIPRFSFCMGKRLLKNADIKTISKRSAIYFYFTVHKIAYIAGNIIEFFRICRTLGNVEQQKGNLGVPRLLIFDITHTCNLNCRICDIWMTSKDEKDIELVYIKKMLSEAKKLGINEIALSGGEALLRKDIFDVFEYAKKLKIKNLGVLSNGVLVGKLFEKLKPFLIDNTISIIASLDSLRAERHNYMRSSREAWAKSVESLKLLSSLKKQYQQVNFGAISIITNENLEELVDLAQYTKDLRANFLQYQAILPNNLNMAERKETPFRVTEERLPLLSNVIGALVEFKNRYPGFIKNSTKNLMLIKEYYAQNVALLDVECSSAGGTVLVSNQGKCSTCFSSFGDIKKKSLESILSSSQRHRARQRVLQCSWPCLLPCFCD